MRPISAHGFWPQIPVSWETETRFDRDRFECRLIMPGTGRESGAGGTVSAAGLRHLKTLLCQAHPSALDMPRAQSGKNACRNRRDRKPDSETQCQRRAEAELFELDAQQ